MGPVRAGRCAYHGLLIRGAQSWINRAKGGGEREGGGGAVASSFLILEYVGRYVPCTLYSTFYIYFMSVCISQDVKIFSFLVLFDFLRIIEQKCSLFFFLNLTTFQSRFL